jgi:Sulfotransferase domain
MQLFGNKNRQLCCFFGHHKCATTWIESMIKPVCNELKLNHCNVHNSKIFREELDQFVETNKIDFLSYTNADYDYVKQLKSFKGFHVVRDPRDIVVSAYFSHLYSHSTEEWSELISYREKLKNMSKDEGLLEEIKFRKKSFEMMGNWDYKLNHVMEIQMEKLIINPYNYFVEILRFLGILNEKSSLKDEFKYDLKKNIAKIQKRILGKEILNTSIKKLRLEEALTIVYLNDFQKKSGGRSKGKENVKSHYRKGIPQDWKNHFNETHIEFFKENYNDLLIKLGYECDDNW